MPGCPIRNRLRSQPPKPRAPARHPKRLPLQSARPIRSPPPSPRRYTSCAGRWVFPNAPRPACWGRRRRSCGAWKILATCHRCARWPDSRRPTGDGSRWSSCRSSVPRRSPRVLQGAEAARRARPRPRTGGAGRPPADAGPRPVHERSGPGVANALLRPGAAGRSKPVSHHPVIDDKTTYYVPAQPGGARPSDITVYTDDHLQAFYTLGRFRNPADVARGIHHARCSIGSVE